jgi:hypothetical protein
MRRIALLVALFLLAGAGILPGQDRKTFDPIDLVSLKSVHGRASKLSNLAGPFRWGHSRARFRNRRGFQLLPTVVTGRLHAGFSYRPRELVRQKSDVPVFNRRRRRSERHCAAGDEARSARREAGQARQSNLADLFARRRGDPGDCDSRWREKVQMVKRWQTVSVR